MKTRLKCILLLLPIFFSFYIAKVDAASTQQQIFDFCKNQMGMNTAAACGVLANIERESSFNPTAQIRDTNGLTSYGLCQWNGPRFTALKNYCASNSYDYTSVIGQLHYLKYELETSESNAYYKIKNVANTSSGAYQAGYNWAKYFERCAQYYKEVDQYAARGNSAQNTYWPMYAQDASATYQGTTFPSTLVQGSSVTMSGTLHSNYNMTWVWVGVCDRAGTTNILETDAHPGATSFDVSSAANSLNYASLPAGDYYFSIHCIVNGKYLVPVRQDFSVVDNIKYYDASGKLWNCSGGAAGSEYKLRTDYPKTSGKYFCGWTYTKGQTTYDVRPGDTITVGSGEVNLYPVYVTHKKAISGDEVEIYNISDFKDTGYNIKKVEHKKENKVDTSYWTDWSSYGLTPVTASSTVQVRTTTMYRYYYFLCPSCGRHEPFTGKSDCGAQISSGAWHETWSTVPYSQSSYGTFSYTKAKYYTTSLGDGQMWIFSSGNVNATAVGTKDATGSAVIIETGYSTRTYVKQSRTDTTIRVAYKITPKSGIKITAQPQSKKVEAGQTAKLTVSASGENLTYQWQYCHAGGTKWYNSSMTGSKTKTLTIKATAARNGQKYRCIIKNTKGSVTSNTAVLTVTAALQITTQPKNQSAAAGKTAKFTVGASGSGLRYQWQYCSATGTKWYNSSMTGNKTKTLTVTATTARNGQKYRCLITNANGKKLTSKVAVLKITK